MLTSSLSDGLFRLSRPERQYLSAHTNHAKSSSIYDAPHQLTPHTKLPLKFWWAYDEKHALRQILNHKTYSYTGKNEWSCLR